MYLYLYDFSLNNKKYNNLLARIETRLTDLGIGGKIFRLSPLRNLNELLKDETRNGIETVIVVGNDKTFTQIVNLAANFDVIVGLIPIGPDNKIAQALGIPTGENACNIIAARKIEKIDLGQANGTYFLSNITVAGGKMSIEWENQFRVIPQSKDQVSICNLKPAFASDYGQNSYFNPQDGLLEVLIKPLATSGFWSNLKKSNSTKDSIIPFKKITIKSRESLSVVTDGQKVLKTPVQIEVAAKKLRLIVGKDRVF